MGPDFHFGVGGDEVESFLGDGSGDEGFGFRHGVDRVRAGSSSLLVDLRVDAVGHGWPLSPARRFSAAMVDMRRRVGTLALAMWGTMMQLLRVRRGRPW